MKHSFEIWMEEQKVDDNIKDILKESVLCHKAGAYRSALVMGVIGFNMILRDRIKDELSNLINYFDTQNTENSHQQLLNVLTVDQNDYDNSLNWINGKEWEKTLFQKLLVDDHMRKLFLIDRLGNIRSEWGFWRNKRNIGAHGVSYNIGGHDVEAFYSWMIQILKILYPLTYHQQILNSIDKFFDNRYTSTTAQTSSLSEKLQTINNDLFIKSLEELKKVIITKFPAERERVLSLFKELYSEKKIEILAFIEQNIDIDNIEWNMQLFITDLLCQDTYYVYFDDSAENDKKHQVQKLLIPNSIKSIDILYSQNAVDETWVSDKLKNNVSLCRELTLTEFNSLSSKLNELVKCELLRRCSDLKNSPSFTTTRDILESIPLYHLNEEQVQLILEGLENNDQIYEYVHIKYYLNEPYQQWKTKFSNLDYSKSDIIIN